MSNSYTESNTTTANENLNKRSKVNAIDFAADMDNSKQIERLGKRAINAFGEISWLVNDAAIGSLEESLVGDSANEFT